MRKATGNSEILKNKSNDRDINFLVVFRPAKPKELLREGITWLTDVGHNSWWHMKRAQHAAYNPKFPNYSDIPVVAINRLKDPPTWLKVATTLEKPPITNHREISSHQGEKIGKNW